MTQTFITHMCFGPVQTNVPLIEAQLQLCLSNSSITVSSLCCYCRVLNLLILSTNSRLFVSTRNLKENGELLQGWKSGTFFF